MADFVPSERSASDRDSRADRADRAAADRGDRTPPHNLDAERSVLGGILLRNDTFNHAAAVIDAGDFYRDAHRRIFEAMVELNERSDAIDLITVKEALTRTGEIEDVGGAAYIARLVDGVPKATNVESLRVDRQGEVDAAVADLRPAREPGGSLCRRRGRRRNPRRRREAGLRGRRQADPQRVHPDLGSRPGELRHPQQAAAAPRPGVGRPDRLHRTRRDDSRPAAGRPGDRRRPSVDG